MVRESSQSIRELLEDLNNLAEKAPEEEARSILSYCIKQLKVSVISHRQDVDSQSNENH